MESRSAAVAAIRPVDMRLVDQLFGMEGGYVLNFSDKTFSEFFDAELGVDIDAERYHVDGSSKGKRLRYFLKSSDQAVRVRLLRALWEYREAMRERYQQEERVPNAAALFDSLLTRVGGSAAGGAVPVPVRTASRVISALRSQLAELGSLAPQPRGYAFERFLKGLFDAYGLAGRAAFRLLGEQIDGSFELAGETYLLEARWQAGPSDAADLYAFHGKVEGKAAWARGLFMSISGFTDEGLVAFGRARRVICMDGSDLRDMLNREIPFPDVVQQKVRRAAETGQPFARVRDLVR